jgi:hypothetical protein
VQSWRSHGEHLDIYAALIHQRQPMLPQVVEPLLDFTSVEPAGTLLSDRRCFPGSTDVSSDKMLFDSYDFHGVIFLSFTFQESDVKFAAIDIGRYVAYCIGWQRPR